MEPTFRVVFCGEVLPGFELSSVKQEAEHRLKTPEAMLAQLFSGRRVILKKGLAQETGKRYIAELENLGMRAFLEEEVAKAEDAHAATPPHAPSAPHAATVFAPSTPSKHGHASAAVIDSTSQDLGAYAPPTETVSQYAARNAPPEPTIFVPPTSHATVPTAEQTVFVPRHPHADATMLADAEALATRALHPAAEPTMLFDPKAPAAQHAPYPAAEPTIFVPRSEDEKQHRMPPAEATVFVPRSTEDSFNRRPPADATVFVPRTADEGHGRVPPADATVFVPKSDTSHAASAPRRSFDSERTLIASAETLAEYFNATAPVQQSTDDPSLLEDSGAIPTPKPEMLAPRTARGSNDKTELAPLPAAAARPGSTDTTVFVAPRRSSSDATVMVPVGTSMSDIRRALAEELDEQEAEEAAAKGQGKGKLIVLGMLILAVAAAAAYYFLGR